MFVVGLVFERALIFLAARDAVELLERILVVRAAKGLQDLGGVGSSEIGMETLTSLESRVALGQKENPLGPQVLVFFPLTNRVLGYPF